MRPRGVHTSLRALYLAEESLYSAVSDHQSQDHPGPLHWNVIFRCLMQKSSMFSRQVQRTCPSTLNFKVLVFLQFAGHTICDQLFPPLSRCSGTQQSSRPKNNKSSSKRSLRTLYIFMDIVYIVTFLFIAP